MNTLKASKLFPAYTNAVAEWIKPSNSTMGNTGFESRLRWMLAKNYIAVNASVKYQLYLFYTAYINKPSSIYGIYEATLAQGLFLRCTDSIVNAIWINYAVAHVKSRRRNIIELLNSFNYCYCGLYRLIWNQI